MADDQHRPPGPPPPPRSHQDEPEPTAPAEAPQGEGATQLFNLKLDSWLTDFVADLHAPGAPGAPAAPAPACAWACLQSWPQ